MVPGLRRALFDALTDAQRSTVSGERVTMPPWNPSLPALRPQR
jgi:hypothetical protein